MASQRLAATRDRRRVDWYELCLLGAVATVGYFVAQERTLRSHLWICNAGLVQLPAQNADSYDVSGFDLRDCRSLRGQKAGYIERKVAPLSAESR